MGTAASNRSGSASLAAFVSSFPVYLVVDFLIHAVFLTRWWQATAGSWHAPETLFAMIPYAYLSFAVYVIASMWLMARVLGPTPGTVRCLVFGLKTGGLFGSIAVLGTYSVLPMPASALIVWPDTFGLESAGAAMAVGLVWRAARPWLRTGQRYRASLLLGAGLPVWIRRILSRLCWTPSSLAATSRS